MEETNEEPFLFSQVEYFDMMSRASRAMRELREEIDLSDQRIIEQMRQLAIEENKKKDFKFLTND